MALAIADIRKKLRKAREAKGLSAEEVAAVVGRSGNSFISRIENGPTNLTISLMNELCAVYGVSPLSILSDETIEVAPANVEKKPSFLEFAKYRADESELSPEAVQDIKSKLPMVRKIGSIAKKLDGNVELFDEIRRAIGDSSPANTAAAKHQGAEAARRLRGILKLGDQPVWDLLSLIWTELRIPVFGANLGEKLWGLYSQDKYGNPFIVYSNSHGFLPRNVFTIAHELGHHIFDYGETIIESDDDKKKKASLLERRADAFAQELLVPIDTLRRVYDEMGFSLVKLRPVHVARLCEYFHVSFLMMSYCLLKANKIKGYEFQKLKQFCVEELKERESELNYNPGSYMLRETSISKLLSEVVAIGMRKSVVSVLEASKILDITPSEATALE